MIKELWTKFEDWFTDLPEPVAAVVGIGGVLWLLVSFMQFWIGVMDAPKSYHMRRVEILFPAYQIGLIAGGRFGGEERIDR